MIQREKNAHGHNNVTNLDEARQAKVMAQSAQIDSSNTDDTVSSDTVSSDTVAAKAKDLHGNRRFDAEKVARIKAAIAAGEYDIDPTRIANKFIEHDRNQ